MARVPRYDLPNAAPDALRIVQEAVNTSDHEHGREWLATPEDLERWLRERGFDARVSRAELGCFHAFRDALRALLIANNERSPVPQDALRQLERAAVRARLTLMFDAGGASELVPGAGSVDGAIGRILAVVHSASSDGTWRRLKACRNCHWAFYDYSRNRSAAWCSMAICGNRLKTRAYRRRVRAR